MITNIFIRNTKAVNPMSYENEKYILQFFEGVHEEENRAELIEVYWKAEAFDEIREARKEILVDVHERGFNIPADQDKFTLLSENIINKYESGEYDA